MATNEADDDGGDANDDDDDWLSWLLLKLPILHLVQFYANDPSAHADSLIRETGIKRNLRKGFG